MRTERIEISKFRSISHLVLRTPELTVLCGANSSGKSNVLRAIRFALLPSYSADRVAENIPAFVRSPNAIIRVKLEFVSPSPELRNALGLGSAASFVYEVDVKRNGSAAFKISGTKVSTEIRARLLEHVSVVFVPAIRDLAGEGLAPFRSMLTDALRRSRGSSVSTLSTNLKLALERKGRELLSGRHFPAIGALGLSAEDVDLQTLLSGARILVRTDEGEIPLHSFGTGHQSQVILGLYRQVGAATGKFVIFQFEEPDNHMHTAAMSTIATDLLTCANDANAQVFVTTHSPALVNQFDLRAVVGLRLNSSNQTERHPIRSEMLDDSYRVSVMQFGLRPAEALTAKKVVVVEGATDVTWVRTLYRWKHRRNPEQDDVLIVQAGGKEPAFKLAMLLRELGVAWQCILDYDACLNQSRPYFKAAVTGASAGALSNAIATLIPAMNATGVKKPRAVKVLEAMQAELASGAPTAQDPFGGSIVAQFLEGVRSHSASEKSALVKSMVNGQLSKWRDPLWKAGIWLWSDDPEVLLVQRDGPLSVAETRLRANGKLQAEIQDRGRLRATVVNKLHGLAVDPTVLSETVLAVLQGGDLGTNQFSALASRLAPA